MPAGPSRRGASSSARAVGATPAASNASGATRPASERRSILRRCPNPASTRANTRRRRSSSPGGSWRSRVTSAESTRGRGWNTVAGTRPTTAASAHHASLHRRDAVGARRPVRRPAARPPPAGPAPRRRRSPGPSARKRSRIVVPTLYGQVGRQPPPGRAGQQAHRDRPRAHRRGPRSAGGSTSARTDSRTGTRWRSISTAVTAAPRSASARVRDPRPGPISSTRSPAPAPASRGDAPHRVGVDDEVLAQRPARRQCRARRAGPGSRAAPIVIGRDPQVGSVVVVVVIGLRRRRGRRRHDRHALRRAGLGPVVGDATGATTRTLVERSCRRARRLGQVVDHQRPGWRPPSPPARATTDADVASGRRPGHRGRTETVGIPGTRLPPARSSSRYAAVALAQVAAAMSATGRPMASASAAPTSTTQAGWFGRPRCGTGARYGLSVSTRIRSSGQRAAAARTSAADGNETMPGERQVAAPGRGTRRPRRGRR